MIVTVVAIIAILTILAAATVRPRDRATWICNHCHAEFTCELDARIHVQAAHPE